METFQYELTPKQFIKAIGRSNQRLMRAMPVHWLLQLLSAAVLAGPSFMLVYSLNLLDSQYAAAVQPLWVAALATLTAHLLYILLRHHAFNRALSQNCRFVGTRTSLTLESGGLRTSSAHGESFTPWAAMQGVELADDVILLLLDKLYFIPVPADAFASQQDRESFIAQVRARIASAEAPPAPASAAPVPEARPPSPAPSFKAAARIFLTGVAQGFKLLVFLRVPEERIRVSWWQIPAFALASLVLSLLWSWFKIGMAGKFMWYSLPMALFHLPVLLLSAIFIAQALRRADKTLLLVQAFLMIALAFDLIMAALSGALTLNAADFSGLFPDGLFFSPPSLWLALACFVAAKRFTLPSLPRRALGMALALALIALPLGLIYRQLNLWELPYDEAQSWHKNSLANEDIYYSQQKMLEQALATLQPERKGVTDIFFIGMAGYGHQDVFMKEVDAVTRLFRERFDAEGHTIRLINNNKSLASSPIASATSLKAALNRTAQVMNKDEDVLFLFLTSHGSESHHFSLALWPLDFKPLDPVRLRALLDESGIKHRVIVVSACYSGGFINALKNENTLVISASAPDKNSFGCGNHNDWTYFGEAYFNEALRKTHSFVEAFQLARPQIEAREKQEKFDPSNPQIAIGAAMQAKLAALEQQLRSRAAPPAIQAADDLAPNPMDNIEQYVDIAFNEKMFADYQNACVAAMQARNPEAAVEQNPNYFSGLNKSSAQWPKLMRAWNQYADAYCTKANNPQLVRRLYARLLRANIAERDLEPVIHFLNSDKGKRWYPAERKVMNQLNVEWARMQNAIEAPLAKAYQEEQTRIHGEFSSAQKPAR